MILMLYRWLTWLVLPLLPLWQTIRSFEGKEDEARWKERYGITPDVRLPGKMLWLHGASIGEALSLLPLLERLLLAYPAASALLTTGTVSSAATIGARLPGRARHQYIPYDTVFGMARFLGHWQPDLAIMVESELWPNLLSQTRRRCPMLLLNGRMSTVSARRWAKAPATIRELLGSFSLILAQSEENASRLRALGAAMVETYGNLKHGNPELPVDPQALVALQSKLGDRTRYLAASTHPGEEVELGRLHRQLKPAHPGLLTVIVPRHPSRAAEIAAELRRLGLLVAQRSQSERIDPETDIYLADTMGELGLFYRVCRIAFIGGSLVPHGGQNPLEGAKLGTAILYGPHMENFAEICRDLDNGGGAERVEDAAALGRALERLWGNDALRTRMIAASAQVTENEDVILDRIQAAIAPYLDMALSEMPVAPMRS